MRKILYYPNEALATVCTEVTEFNKELHKELDDMRDVMKFADGVGLAANQIGILKRMFIMLDSNSNLIECVNPKILEFDGGAARIEESCLSAPKLFGVVASRSLQVTVEAYTRDGEKMKFALYGHESVCFQHEYDHLEGIFWFSKLPRNPRRALEKKWEKKRKKMGV